MPDDKDLTLSQQHLWRFANRFYANKSVEQALLKAQNEYDADVCLLLFLIWHCCDLDQQQEVLNKDDLPAIEEQLDAWRSELIQPLRALRKNLKQLQCEQSDTLNPKRFIEDIKALELKAEQAQLQFLAERYHKTAESFMRANKAEDISINKSVLDALIRSYQGEAVADLVFNIIDMAEQAYQASAKELVKKV